MNNVLKFIQKLGKKHGFLGKIKEVFLDINGKTLYNERKLTKYYHKYAGQRKKLGICKITRALAGGFPRPKWQYRRYMRAVFLWKGANQCI
ncbi:MAG: hypothetical protein ACOYBE_04135 [Blautia sp.]|jgi:hypothetical protein